MPVKDDIQAEAFNLGFSLFGVTLPIRPPTYPTYLRWLELGRHGDMAYLANERARLRRADPKEIQPEARSILALAMRYPAPAEIPPAADYRSTGRIAAYAWGEDYHEIIPPRMEALRQQVGRILGREPAWRGYTDTGPILERDAAQRAGLGWMGKNTCLISPAQGSYFLLAEALVDAEIEPDPPFRTDQCGTCRRCIEACPTACIQEDRTIDARRCISYLTIENKGAIPADLREPVGNWVFGCDVCQQVCPWNIRFAAPEGDPAFAPRPGIPHPTLVEELRLTPQAFNRKFKNNPVRRAKRRGYLRNVAVALGNARDPDSIPDLILALDNEPEPLVRAHAAWALGQIAAPPARAALERALRREEDPAVTAEITVALSITN